MRLCCVLTGKTSLDPNRFKLDGDGYYQSAAEMRQILGSTKCRARVTTLLIAERAQSPRRRDSARPMPSFGAHGGELSVLAASRGRRRDFRPPAGRYRERATYETDVTRSKGFPSYLLTSPT